MTTHWGEIATVPDTDSGIAAIEREQMTKLRSMDVEGPRLHQPSSRHYPPTNEPLPAEKFQIDPLVLHSIRLLEHARKLRGLSNSLLHQQQQSQDSQRSIDFDVTYPDAPPIPELSGQVPKCKLHQPVPYLVKDMDSDFVRGVPVQLPRIDNVSCRHMLRRSVAAVCAHTGFESCPESVLETLTDVTHDYYLQFTHHLRAAADNIAGHQPDAFPDIIERVFSEMNIGSVTCLHDFYQKRVINYHSNLEDTCRQLDAEYEKLKEPMVQKPPDTLSVIRIKEEPSEIHFPELDEIDEVNDAEQLLNLENLGGFEITVEHESASGLTTEVDSKWSQVKHEQKIKIEHFEDSNSESEVEHHAVQSSPEADSPSSLPMEEIASPSSVPGPSQPKKKKT